MLAVFFLLFKISISLFRNSTWHQILDEAYMNDEEGSLGKLTLSASRQMLYCKN